MIGEKLTNIQLSDRDIERFKTFCQYHDVFEALLKGGVFDLKWGKAVLDFNVEGLLMDIKVTRTTYRKGDKN